LNWKLLGILIPAAAVLWAGVSSSIGFPPQRAEWRESYKRPADSPYPPENPYSAEKAELGKQLFFDPILSGSRVRSCSSCHSPGLSWGDGRPRAIGEGQAVLPWRSPTLIAIAYIPKLGWDGKFRDIESVAFGPITSPLNMNLPEAEALARLNAIPGYVAGFARAFGEEGITRRKVELALATFQRSLDPGKTAFDRWIEGDERAISDAAKRGFDTFNSKGRCASCHGGYAFTDGSFHDIGTGKGADVGRGRLFPHSTPLRHAFKTPTLRDVMRRAPYMHDGSVPTLEEVIALYDRGGIDRPSRSKQIVPLGLTADEKAELVAFLETLNSPPQRFELPRLPR
jgi:cytochrome c peroxidase